FPKKVAPIKSENVLVKIKYRSVMTIGTRKLRIKTRSGLVKVKNRSLIVFILMIFFSGSERIKRKTSNAAKSKIATILKRNAMPRRIPATEREYLVLSILYFVSVVE